MALYHTARDIDPGWRLAGYLIRCNWAYIWFLAFLNTLRSIFIPCRLLYHSLIIQIDWLIAVISIIDRGWKSIQLPRMFFLELNVTSATILHRILFPSFDVPTSSHLSSTLALHAFTSASCFFLKDLIPVCSLLAFELSHTWFPCGDFKAEEVTNRIPRFRMSQVGVSRRIKFALLGPGSHRAPGFRSGR